MLVSKSKLKTIVVPNVHVKSLRNIIKNSNNAKRSTILSSAVKYTKLPHRSEDKV